MGQRTNGRLKLASVLQQLSCFTDLGGLVIEKEESTDSNAEKIYSLYSPVAKGSIYVRFKPERLPVEINCGVFAAP